MDKLEIIPIECLSNIISSCAAVVGMILLSNNVSCKSIKIPEVFTWNPIMYIWSLEWMTLVIYSVSILRSYWMWVRDGDCSRNLFRLSYMSKLTLKNWIKYFQRICPCRRIVAIWNNNLLITVNATPNFKRTFWRNDNWYFLPS